jgi:hypothetical protein
MVILPASDRAVRSHSNTARRLLTCSRPLEPADSRRPGVSSGKKGAWHERSTNAKTCTVTVTAASGGPMPDLGMRKKLKKMKKCQARFYAFI